MTPFLSWLTLFGSLFIIAVIALILLEVIERVEALAARRRNRPRYRRSGR